MFTYFVIIIRIRMIYSQICVNFIILGKMEMKGQKENIQDKSRKLKLSKYLSLDSFRHILLKHNSVLCWL